jgi:hypothetical protein
MVKKEVLQKMYDEDAQIEAARMESLERMALLQRERSATAEHIAAASSTLVEVAQEAQCVGAPPTPPGTPPPTPPGTPPRTTLRPATPPGTPPLTPLSADAFAVPTAAMPVTPATIAAALATLSGDSSADDAAPARSRTRATDAASAIVAEDNYSAAPPLAAVFNSPARRPRAALDGKTVSFILFTVTFNANRARNLTRSP